MYVDLKEKCWCKMSSTLAAIQAQSKSRVAEEKKLLDRRRELLVLIADFLETSGLVSTAETLQKESSLVSSKLEVADNVDLMVSQIAFLPSTHKRKFLLVGHAELFL